MNRKAELSRVTKETDIQCALDLQGGKTAVSTGIGFFDHMLEAFALHAGWALSLTAKGDLEVDGHHLVEDAGIVLGKALFEACGDKSGLRRFGNAYVPMDEALGFAAVDIGGRAFLAFETVFPQAMIGAYDSCLTREFFRAFASNAAVTLHMNVSGVNAHHMTEALFKAAGRALGAAAAPGAAGILSTKGVL